jgi:hypothetical protein
LSGDLALRSRRRANSREREIAICTIIAAIGARIAVSKSVSTLPPRPRSSLLP